MTTWTTVSENTSSYTQNSEVYAIAGVAIAGVSVCGTDRWTTQTENTSTWTAQ